LFKALGWNTEDRDEVSTEEKISKGRVDYAFRINGIPKLFLEAKSLKADLDKPIWSQQAINYAWLKGTTWAVLSDFEGLKVFNSEVKTKRLSECLFLEIKWNEYIPRFDQLWLLSKDSLEQGLLDKEAEKWGKKLKKSPIDKQLLLDFTNWRSILTKDILKNNEKINLTEEQLDESVQRILDRLIFIRKAEDKELEPKKLISRLRVWEDKGRGQLIKELVELFEYFDKEYNSKLFMKHLCDDLVINNDTLRTILGGLYDSDDRTISYDFSVIDADILGNIYEQYLSHILKKTAKRAKVEVKKSYRKEHGVYYTPTYIVDYIVRNTLGELLKNKKPEEVEKIKVLDPACGSGSFLIKAFDVFDEYFKKNMKGIDTFFRKGKILTDNIFGVDLDPKAAEIAQLNLLLKTAEKRQRLPMLQNNIKIGNSLIDDPEVAGNRAFKWNEEFKKIMDEGGFDVVIGNPPYIRIQTLENKSVDFFNLHYNSAKKNYDIYALFVEKGFSLLKEGGMLGFILPSKFFNADYGAGLRKIIADNKALYKIMDFKDFQVFDDATTYTCLLFLKKSKNNKFDYLEFIDKDKLNASSNPLAKDSFKKSVQSQPSGIDNWNFVGIENKRIMDKLRPIKLRLGDVSENIFQGIITGADKIYILIKKDNGLFYSSETKKEYNLEIELLHPLLKGSKHIRRYLTEYTEKYVIFPYKIIENKAVPIEEHELKKKFPIVWNYLNENKTVLEKRDSGKMKGSSWYLFSRNQNLSRFGQTKIMTPSIAKLSSFTYDEKSDFFFVGSGGGGGGAYGITLKNIGLYLYILSILNSKLISYFIRQISSKFSGGYFAFNKQYIEKVPIIISSNKEKYKLIDLAKIHLEKSKRLCELGDKKTDERVKIEEEIKKIDNEIDSVVYKIYGITPEEQKIIEESLN
ncbi:MAG: N-6 DNA methylase, partial [Candidatus Aenigmatarchaeota archaeon]